MNFRTAMFFTPLQLSVVTLFMAAQIDSLVVCHAQDQDNTSSKLPAVGKEHRNDHLVFKTEKFDLQYQVGGVIKHATDTYPEERKPTIGKLNAAYVLTLKTDKAADHFNKMIAANASDRSTVLSGGIGAAIPGAFVVKAISGIALGKVLANATSPKWIFLRGDTLTISHVAEYSEQDNRTKMIRTERYSGTRDGEEKVFKVTWEKVFDGMVLVSALEDAALLSQKVSTSEQ